MLFWPSNLHDFFALDVFLVVILNFVVGLFFGIGRVFRVPCDSPGTTSLMWRLVWPAKMRVSDCLR